MGIENDRFLYLIISLLVLHESTKQVDWHADTDLRSDESQFELRRRIDVIGQGNTREKHNVRRFLSIISACTTEVGPKPTSYQIRRMNSTMLASPTADHIRQNSHQRPAALPHRSISVGVHLWSVVLPDQSFSP
jgi:hypothetical protein